MNMYPPSMPSEIWSMRVYVFANSLIALALLASLLWQWNRPPSDRLAVSWGLGAVLIVFLGRYGGAGGFNTVVLLTVLAIQMLAVFVGLLRNAFRSPLVSMDSFIIASIVVAAIYLLQPPLGHRGEAVWRSHCKNNLKIIGLTLTDMAEDAGFSPVTGTPHVSWRVTLLPHLDATALGAGYDQTRVWNQGENLQVGRREPVPYRCPSHSEETHLGDLACTDYALVTGAGTIFPTSESNFDFSQITDGAFNTILAVECSGLRIPWTEPRDVDINQVHMTIDELGPDGGSPSLLSSYHTTSQRNSHGVFVVLADGSVRYLSSEIKPELLKKLLTANGNEPIEEGF